MIFYNCNYDISNMYIYNIILLVKIIMEKKDALKNIEDLINQLEKINLSPLPSTSKDSQKFKQDVIIRIKKIVYFFDIILSNKLRLDLSQKNIKAEDNHYWTYLSKYYQIPSVKFCNLSEQVHEPSKRGMLWILLSIAEKSFNESVNEIYNQSFDKKFYDKSSLIVTKKNEILELCNRLNTIHFPVVKKDINEEYFKYKQGYQEQKENEELNEDLYFISPIVKQAPEKNIFVSNYNLESLSKIPINNFNNVPANNNNNLNSMFFSRATIDLQPSNDKIGMDSLFNSIDNDERENNAPLIDDEPEQINTESNQKRSIAQKYDGNSKAINFFSKFATEKENYIITKTADFQNVFVEEFYTFKENTKKASTKKTDVYNIMNENQAKTKYDLILNPKKIINYPIDKYFKATRRVERNIFTKKDVILYKGKEIKLTNSILFYLNNYYKKETYMKFRTKKSSLKPITIEAQNYQCALCNRQFNTIMNIPTETIYWCSYYLRFICKDCISNDYSIIPDFILKLWSFKKFQISKKAKNLLEKWYNKPVIYIKQSDPIIKKSEQLRSALILKRKIHKIFDLMKCEKANDFVKETLGEHKYLVLHENLFSLEDLVEIYEETFFDKLNTYYKKMKQHILVDCTVCNYTGGRCLMCMSKEIIYAFDVENVIYCNDCKKMFHKKCCTVHPCIVDR